MERSSRNLIKQTTAFIFGDILSAVCIFPFYSETLYNFRCNELCYIEVLFHIFYYCWGQEIVRYTEDFWRFVISRFHCVMKHHHFKCLRPTYISTCHYWITGISHVSAFDAKLLILANNHKCSCCFTRSEKVSRDITHASRVNFLGIISKEFYGTCRLELAHKSSSKRERKIFFISVFSFKSEREAKDFDKVYCTRCLATSTCIQKKEL